MGRGGASAREVVQIPLTASHEGEPLDAATTVALHEAVAEIVRTERRRLVGADSPNGAAFREVVRGLAVAKGGMASWWDTLAERIERLATAHQGKRTAALAYIILETVETRFTDINDSPYELEPILDALDTLDKPPTAPSGAPAAETFLADVTLPNDDPHVPPIKTQWRGFWAPFAPNHVFFPYAGVAYARMDPTVRKKRSKYSTAGYVRRLAIDAVRKDYSMPHLRTLFLIKPECSCFQKKAHGTCPDEQIIDFMRAHGLDLRADATPPYTPFEALSYATYNSEDANRRAQFAPPYARWGRRQP